MKSHSNAYRDAGVDIDAGDALVERIRPHVKRTHRTGIMADIGGFGALFDLKSCGYRDPVLVSSTDGVGTKLRLAIDTGRHDTIGQDLVAMCVNDLIVQGAEPLFFLDYFACGKLDVAIAERVIAGIAKACADSGCALIGGETAEMPGHYATEDYDLAGFTVGAVERDQIITGAGIEPGDIVLGVASSGPHSNGYSLIRKILSDKGLGWNDPAPSNRDAAWLTSCWSRPGFMSVPSFRPCAPEPALPAWPDITGGGLLENIPRVLPKGVAVELDTDSWALPPVFQWLAREGGLTATELARTLNCGIGLVAITDEANAAIFTDSLEQSGENVFIIGRVIAAADQHVRLNDAAAIWGLPE